MNLRVTIVTHLVLLKSMKTVTIRDFRSKPKQVREDLAKLDEALLTANGKPVALMLPVDAGTLEDTLDYVRRAKALQALSEIREDALEYGRDRITMEEIDQEIQAVRQERKRMDQNSAD